MDALARFLDDVSRNERLIGHFRGLLHVLIGRRIETTEGTVISKGLTWREVAALLKRVRWDKDAVAELGLEPANLPPRDRERYWYNAIAHAELDGALARKQADQLAQQLKLMGYVIGPAPVSS